MKAEPRVTLADLNTVPSSNGSGPEHERDTWIPLNLADLTDTPPAPPTLGGFGIIYHGKRHVFSGPPESAKTLAAYAIGLETLRAHPGRHISIIDFEMGPRTARTRLLELGATPSELAHIHYIAPEAPATTDRIQLLVTLNPVLVIIDAAVGAYVGNSLDDNQRGDVERFTNLYTRPFAQAEIATIVLDHVTKDHETRGKWTIGSERKLGGVDVHLGFETILPVKRGSTGLYKILMHKDRDGWHDRGTLAEMHLNSHPETHQLTWRFEKTEHAEPGEQWMPTKVMEKISSLLQLQHEPISRNAVHQLAGGKRDVALNATDHLIRLGYATETEGPRRSKLIRHDHPFTVSEWQNQPDPPLVPTGSPLVPGTTDRRLVPGTPIGVPDRNQSVHPQNHPTSSQDPEVQALLEHYHLTDPETKKR